MRKSLAKLIAGSIILIYLMGNGVISAVSGPLEQVTTPMLPTVTGTAKGPMVTVSGDGEEIINVRSGPGIFYDKIGVLVIGQEMPAVGISAGGEWILIEYPGVPRGQAWVYEPFVVLSPGANLPIVEPPPTPTPLYTTTIDPTLAAQYVVTVVPTRLPSFTPPPPLSIPTYEAVTWRSTSGVPMGLIIIVLFAVGAFLGLFTIAQGK